MNGTFIQSRYKKAYTALVTIYNRDETVSISGPILREIAEKSATDLGYSDFKGIKFSLVKYNFKNRNEIVNKVVRSESVFMFRVIEILPNLLTC